MYSTINEFQERLVELAGRYSDKALLGYIVQRWSQGRHVDLSLEEMEPLLVKRREIKRIVEGAVRRLLDYFESPFYGAEIFVIYSPQHTYGTGKSQVAVFIAKELEARGRGIKTRFISYASKTNSKKPISSGVFATTLLAVSFDPKLAVFIDELDLLVSTQLTPEEQAKAVEEFASVLIKYTESPPRRDLKHAVIPILSYRLEEEIKHLARDRLSRRLMNVIARVSLHLGEGDIYEIFETTTILAALHEGLVPPGSLPDPQLLTFLYRFARDYAEWFWPREEVTGLAVGTAVANALSMSRLYVQGLAEASPDPGSLENPAGLGRLCEDTVRQVLKVMLPHYEKKIRHGEEVYTVTWLLDTKSSKVRQSIVDMRYLARIGGVELGSVAVEVTAEKTLSSHKLGQIGDYVSQGPVILVHLYSDEADKQHMAEDIGSLATPNPVDLLQLPLHLFKYPAILGDHGRDLALHVAKERGLIEGVKAILGRAAEILFNRWMAATMLREASTSPGEEAAEKMSKAVLGVARSFVASLRFTGPGRLKYRKMSTISSLLAGSMAALGPQGSLDPATLASLAESIATEWGRQGLGRKTKKQFRPGDNWSDEEAARIAAELIEQLLAGGSRGG